MCVSLTRTMRLIDAWWIPGLYRCGRIRRGSPSLHYWLLVALPCCIVPCLSTHTLTHTFSRTRAHTHTHTRTHTHTHTHTRAPARVFGHCPSRTTGNPGSCGDSNCGAALYIRGSLRACHAPPARETHAHGVWREASTPYNDSSKGATRSSADAWSELSSCGTLRRCKSTR